VKLIITEKPSVAQTLAAILGATQRRDGYFEGNGWLISWCYGHLVEMAPADAYGEQYKRWSYDSLPILPDVWKYRAADGKKKQLDILRSLMNRCKKPVQRHGTTSLRGVHRIITGDFSIHGLVKG